MLTFLQNYDPLLVSFSSLIIYFFIILLFFRFAGKIGVFLFISIAIIGANLQVLKLSHFSFFQEPVALGTVLFSTIFFCTDLLSEHYGARVARQSVYVGFGAFFLWMLITQVTLGYPPLSEEQAGVNFSWALSIHPSLVILFTLVPSFFFASVISYWVSQLGDIFFYELIRKKTKGRFLFLRNNLSTIVSSLIDNTVFSVLAFVVFNSEPLELKTLIFTFILGTFILRVFYSLFDTPFIYLSYYFLPAEIKKKEEKRY